MAFDPSKPKVRIPKFSSNDPGLENALNTLGEAIMRIQDSIPDVRMPTRGTTKWTGNSVLLEPDTYSRDTLPPFWPILFSENSTEFKVSLTKGLVVFRGKCPETGKDAPIYLDPLNRLDGDNFPRKFDIALDQIICVVVNADAVTLIEEGDYYSALKIVVMDDTVDFTHVCPGSGSAWTPGERSTIEGGVGGENSGGGIEGAVGGIGGTGTEAPAEETIPEGQEPPEGEPTPTEYYYKLAKLIKDQETGAVRFVMFLAGSHIEHMADMVYPPLWPVLHKQDANTYEVTITRGVVIDNKVFGEDETNMRETHEIVGLLDEDGEVKSWPIHSGDYVCVMFETDEMGVVKPADPEAEPPVEGPRIVITDEPDNTVHHDPPAGTQSSGETGVTVVRLAKARYRGEQLYLEMYEAGNNVYNTGIPTMKALGGEVDLVVDYDLKAGFFQLLGLNAGSNINFEVISNAPPPNGDGKPVSLTISSTLAGGDYENLNLEFYEIPYNNNGEIIHANIPSTPSSILYWRNGHFIGDVAPTPEEGVEPPAGLITKAVHNLVSTP